MAASAIGHVKCFLAMSFAQLGAWAGIYFSSGLDWKGRSTLVVLRS